MVLPDIHAPSNRAAYRGRFAPSPTGPLHIGSVFTALTGFLQARANNGAWLLRIDDLDSYRTVPGAADGILATLEQLGLHWDAAVTYQSDNLELYREALNTLERAGHTYRCTCSRRTLRQTENAPNQVQPYPGYCEKLNPDPTHPHAVRVKARATIDFTDRLQGLRSYTLPITTGDFILRRRDGIIAYHLATVIDDHQAQITETLRGMDLLDATACQIHLKNLLAIPDSDYLHIPILVDSQGNKYSKQTGAQAVDTTNPVELLLKLLYLLRQNPPAELSVASVEEILTWAIQCWDISKLKSPLPPLL